MSKFQKAMSDMRSKREKIASDIGFLIEGKAKANAPVLTGHLRQSTNAESTHGDEKSEIFIGTNDVEYTAVIHEGSSVTGQGGQPFIRDAVEQSLTSIKSMIQQGLKP